MEQKLTIERFILTVGCLLVFVFVLRFKRVDLRVASLLFCYCCCCFWTRIDFLCPSEIFANYLYCTRLQAQDCKPNLSRLICCLCISGLYLFLCSNQLYQAKFSIMGIANHISNTSTYKARADRAKRSRRKK